LAAWGAGEAAYGLFEPDIVLPPNFQEMSTYEKSNYLAQEDTRKIPPAEAKNTALAYGLLGACLGAALGLAGGLSRGSLRTGLYIAVLGLVGGGIAGAGVSAGATTLFFRYLDPEAGLKLPLLTHGAIFAVVGAAGGAALGLGLGDRRAVLLGLIGGLIGGILGTLLYELLVAIAYPTMRVEQPVPAEGIPRLLAHLFVAISVAAFAVLSIQGRKPAGAAHPLPRS
jgi:uncharacterized membrane protein